MKLPGFGTRIGILCLGLSVSFLGLAVSGCAVASKSVSVDSTSKSPWFNLELKGKKKTYDNRTIRFDKGSKSRVETVGNSEGSADPARLPRKSSLALPTTDQALVLDSTRDQPEELDFR
jgi:hypothetical protein